MMKCLLPLFTVLSLSLPSVAIENLGPACELSLRTDPKFNISSHIRVNLQEDQILVRGELEPFWGTGMEDQTAWSIRDEFFDRKIIQDPYISLFNLRKGDRLFILAPSGNVMISGYYRERFVRRKVIYGDSSFETRPNMPGLYKDFELTESLISSQKLAELFHKKYEAVLVRTLKDGEKQRLTEIYGPLLIAHYRHLLSSERFLKLNATTTLEIAHFETLLQGTFSFEVSEIEKLASDPKLGNVFRLPSELAVVPFVQVDGGQNRQSLHYGDELIMLDLMNNIVHREKITYFKENRGMLTTNEKSDHRLPDLLNKARRTVRAVVIRQR